jgi:hypothetical protein
MNHLAATPAGRIALPSRILRYAGNISLRWASLTAVAVAGLTALLLLVTAGDSPKEAGTPLRSPHKARGQHPGPHKEGAQNPGPSTAAAGQPGQVFVQAANYSCNNPRPLKLPSGSTRPVKPDSLAPPGATPDWLPEDDWVQERWLPYHEKDLWCVLHTGREEMRRWLLMRPLGDLARAKGIDPRAALRRLMRPVRQEIRGPAYRTLVKRARRTFTQRHLMQHMLGHMLHVRAWSRGVPRALGVSWPEIVALQHQGLELRDIAERQGLQLDDVNRRLGADLRAASRRGVRLKATPRRQAAFWLNEQLRYIKTTLFGPSRG